ncbi:uncharacterized protein C2845_PM15G02700 [Panicum miliaceum]|uniref:HR-like lesion-inducer n=1 Tax=Panicum miliaceum TaxID=4540 RepID=A0A3L6QA41_PANMI|nr:uncharacterized protein C2845_PM15G02700 [Panicum miliaceum]
MGFISFVGRVLFASLFLLSAYQEFIEFGNDGGPAAKALKPKFNLFIKQVSKNTGLGVPHIDIKTVIAATMFLKGFGGLLFIFSSSFGAFLLLIYLAFITPVVYDFYNYEIESGQFVQLFFKFSQLLLIVTSYVLHLLSELGVYRCPAFLPGNEELYSKKALQRKDNKDQDKLKSAIVGWEAIKLLMFAYYKPC